MLIAQSLVPRSKTRRSISCGLTAAYAEACLLVKEIPYRA